MNLRAVVIGCALAAASRPARGYAQAGANAAIILELPASARALALGDAFVAVSGGDAMLFYNPAQLSSLKARGRSASLSIQRYLASSTLGAASVSARFKRGTLGIGAQMLDYGDAEEIVADPASGTARGIPTGGIVSGVNYAVSAAFAGRWRRARVGVAAKYVTQRLAGTGDGSFAADFGAAVDGWRGTTLAIAAQNLGGDVELAGMASPLPAKLRVGASVPVWRSTSASLLGAVELTRTRGAGASVGGGLELQFNRRPGLDLFLRAGARDLPDGAAARPVTFGGGVRARRLALDYAYQGFETLGGTHRFGVTWWR